MSLVGNNHTLRKFLTFLEAMTRQPAQLSLAFASVILCLPTYGQAFRQANPSQPQTPLVSTANITANQGSGTNATTALTIDAAIGLALAQASAFSQAQLSERIAAEDVRQARVAFYPKITGTSAYTYTSPELGPAAAETTRSTRQTDTPATPSFIAANAVNEYLGVVGVNGDVDLAGRLRATLVRSRALLAAAHAGTEMARRALAAATIDAYYSLALANAKRRVAEQNLAAAQEFEGVTSLLLSGGEVAQVDVTRARLQTTTRRDELEQARAGELAAADGLRVLVGYDFSTPVMTSDLMAALPQPGEIDNFSETSITRRPEFAQFAAEFEAARQEARQARAERLPQLSYVINSGFDSDALLGSTIHRHTGVSAMFSLTIPIFDFGASRSRERQARLRGEVIQSERSLSQRTFTQQFYTARAQALSAATRIAIAREGISDAERNVTASIARYRAGEAPILEVTDAQTTLANERAALYQAIYDYQTARAHLQQVAGQ